MLQSADDCERDPGMSGQPLHSQETVHATGLQWRHPRKGAQANPMLKHLQFSAGYRANLWDQLRWSRLHCQCLRPAEVSPTL